MNRSLAFTLSGVLLLAYGAGAQAGWFGPSNYEECIIHGMKGVTSDVAAHSIRAACRNKFADPPEDKPNYEQLPAKALAKIEAKSYDRKKRGHFKEYIQLEVYNGNEDWKVISLVARITDTTTQTYRDYGSSNVGVGAVREGVSPDYDPLAWARAIARYSHDEPEGAAPFSDFTFYFEPNELPEPLSVAIVSARGVRQ